MEVISKSDKRLILYKEILKKESHHDHKIYLDEFNTLRWKPDNLTKLLVNLTDFNVIIGDLVINDYDKNSEEYRLLYRNIGCSLSKYWKIFYCEVNNPILNSYRQPNKT